MNKIKNVHDMNNIQNINNMNDISNINIIRNINNVDNTHLGTLSGNGRPSSLAEDMCVSACPTPFWQGFLALFLLGVSVLGCRV